MGEKEKRGRVILFANRRNQEEVEWVGEKLVVGRELRTTVER